MVLFSGTQAVTVFKNALHVITDTLDADGEFGNTLDMNDFGFIPTHATLISTHAGTDNYDLDLQWSEDSTTFTADFLTNTTKETLAQTTVDFTSAVGVVNPASRRFWRILLIDRTTGAESPVITATWKLIHLGGLI